MSASNTAEKLPPKRITQAMRKHGFDFTLRRVVSDRYTLIKPIELMFRYDPGSDEWVADFYPTTIATSGSTPQAALDSMRDLLVVVYGMWEKNPTGHWGHLSPESLKLLDKHFARKTH